MEIHVLHRQGKGVREIARAPGLSRNTVRAVLRGEPMANTAHEDERQQARPVQGVPEGASRQAGESGCRRRCYCAKSEQGFAGS